MAWWRGDPSLISRSPFHRYAQRVLRDHEATLRTRCFSRTPSKSAQHEDDGGGKRPANLTNLEWMQLQHYERWRKRLVEDPYKTIFGASNDMLSGKGLKDWEWVHKSFPKWMLQEMDMDENSKKGSKGNPEQSKYPKKVKASKDEVRQAREPYFPQPSFKRARFERDESSGIVSPSDLRRPREGSHVEVTGKVSSEAPVKETATSDELPSYEQSTIFVPPTPEPMKKNDTTAGQALELTNVTRSAAKAAREEASARESSFIEEFFNTESEQQKSSPTNGDSRAWRETALQRRAASGVMAKSRVQSSLTSHTSHDALSAEHVLPISSSRATEGSTKVQLIEPRSKNVDWLIQQEIPVVSKKAKTQDDTSSPRSASRSLSQLPEDDIDFLSATDIRASMGAKRSRIPTDEQRQAERQHLEKAFAAADETPRIDSMTEAKIINDQYVRRTEREMRDTQSAPEAKAAPSLEEPVSQIPARDIPIESSIDRMKKWLETTGASFAKQFWQDPTEEADVTKTRMFFDKAAHYLKKGQATTRQITDDLEKDIPASKALLKRLKSDEEMLDLAVHRLRQRSSSGSMQGLSPRKIRAMESLKTRFHQTNNELEKAYAALRELTGTDAVTNATGSFKRRLAVASKVLHKNAQLLRMLIWSLQTRLEDPKIDRNILSNYKVVADNLLSLRDTQMTLMRLIDRAMLIYGVVPDIANDVKTLDGKTEEPDYTTCEEPFVRARLAADTHLINEIKAHKSAMQGLSDDGYSRAPKPTASKVLDEPIPLAHSMFRPFGAAFENLGTTNASDTATEKAKEAETMKLGDLKLIAEVKAAYEDVYGAITVDHRQVSPAFEEVNTGEYKAVKKFEMLKEDPTVVNSESLTDATVATDATKATGGPNVIAAPLEMSLLQMSPSNEVSATPSETAISTGPVPPASESEVSPATVSTTSPSSTLEARTDMSDTTASASAFTDIPTHYTILVRDPQTDTLSITTSSTGPPRDTSPALPLHQALSALDSPAKFIPYITEGLEVVSAKKDLLVLRDALDSTASTRPFETIRTLSPSASYEDLDANRGTVNPIDGTARLSPTGYVGPEESPEQLEREFEERRQAAEKLNGKEEPEDEKPREEAKKKKRRGGAGGVVKTAIWVAGICYVVGVFGEIANAPFKG